MELVTTERESRNLPAGVDCQSNAILISGNRGKFMDITTRIQNRLELKDVAGGKARWTKGCVLRDTRDLTSAVDLVGSAIVSAQHRKDSHMAVVPEHRTTNQLRTMETKVSSVWVRL